MMTDMTADDPRLPGQAGLRVSDADRDTVVELLKDRTADGTLTLDEFALRVDAAIRARDRAELDAVSRDLPTTISGSPKRRPTTSTVLSIMGGNGTRGRWRCAERVVAVAVMGGCQVDLREAEIDSPEVHITAVAVMGGIDIVVPEGIEVSVDGLPVMGGRNVHVKDVPRLPGSPRIVVHAFPIMGGVHVRSRPRKGTRPEPELQPEVAPLSSIPFDGTVTIMFSDVSDYSGITERLGDTAAHELLREYTMEVRRHIAANAGQEVKSHGDGLMVAFPSVGRAVRCAVDVQQGLAKRNVETTTEELHAHIGIHAGEVVRDGNDYLGSTVIIASRLADAAAPDEILVSSVARELVAGSREFDFADAREMSLKGLTEARMAYPVLWQSGG